MSLRDKVVEMKEELEEVRKMGQENSLATEMLRELKVQNKRQHITILVLIGVIISMVIAFFIYEKQFQTIAGEETEQVIEDIDNSQDSTYTQQIN